MSRVAKISALTLGLVDVALHRGLSCLSMLPSWEPYIHLAPKSKVLFTVQTLGSYLCHLS